jgi:hypothetical protein
MKKLSETQKKVMEFLSKHPDSSPEKISEGTSLVKLTVFAALKSLVALKVVNKHEEEGKKSYRLVEESSQEKSQPSSAKKKAQKKNSNSTRDFTKYKFNGTLHSKGKLVLAIVTQYVRDHRNVTVAKLKEVFPDSLIPAYGVLQELSIAKKRSGDKMRFFMKPDEIIKLRDKTVAVTNQLTSSSLETFLAAAKKAGYKAQPE